MDEKDFENYSDCMNEDNKSMQSREKFNIADNLSNIVDGTNEENMDNSIMDNKDNNSKESILDENISEDKNNNYVKDILEMIIYFAVVICSVLLIHQFVGQQIEVSGSSMESTLHDADHLILEKLSYQFGEPKRFDIIVFRPYPADKEVYYIKRVIGLPGEKIQIIGSDIYIDGELLEEDYGYEEIIDGGIAGDRIELGEDEYFVLGDNRNNSKDSRDPSIGPVHKSSIMGRAWVRIWPVSDFGVLEHQ
jgi:signal peptidase I